MRSRSFLTLLHSLLWGALALGSLSLGLVAGASPASAEASAKRLLLATTTSFRDSGLLDALLPLFRERTGIEVQVVAVGTGAALRMGAEGNADVLVTHARPGEEELVASGAALGRVPFMRNHFVLVGPASDPAKVGAAADVIEGLRRIADAQVAFVSRGDDSGTHRKEQALLRLAGLDPQTPWQGVIETGSGMGFSLQVAAEREAYVLSDLGTFLNYRERTGLVRHSRDEPRLENVYSVLRVDPDRFAGRVRRDEPRAFEGFLLSPEAQREIGRFGRERFGAPLFQPLRRVENARVE